MSTLTDTALSARYKNGLIIIQMESGIEIRFPVSGNERLAHGTFAQLNHIEISPYGLHWPELNEDLSFKGLFAGDYGQFVGKKTSPSKKRSAIRR
ncbi:DUF2442 domain-containing protein [bacterium]|nr:DUF2442 domain-containing protein [bacterium]